ncbi:MAG: 4-alpha-glucanotransferase, partial [Lachnospiraceae bacterium]|nr:4-alpha-glucanotransferase [Lachnospiraceae bacterium]
MRASGILLPISSLPSNYGIGCFSKEAYAFVDGLNKAHQRFWQILPLGQTSFGDSPYQSFSTFAGNPYFIDLEKLIGEGLLTKEECDECDFGDDDSCIDYGKIYEERYDLLWSAFQNSDIEQNEEFLKFQKENEDWLPDYALYMA